MTDGLKLAQDECCRSVSVNNSQRGTPFCHLGLPLLSIKPLVFRREGLRMNQSLPLLDQNKPFWDNRLENNQASKYLMCENCLSRACFFPCACFKVSQSHLDNWTLFMTSELFNNDLSTRVTVQFLVHNSHYHFIFDGGIFFSHVVTYLFFHLFLFGC